MKKLLIVLSILSAFLFSSCSDDSCSKDNECCKDKKECCDKDKKECKEGEKKECCHKSDKKECAADCKKECCAKKDTATTEEVETPSLETEVEEVVEHVESEVAE